MQQRTLREALGGMAQIPQFFIWHLTWNDAEAKFNKLPFTNDHSAQNPANWMTYDAAVQRLQECRAQWPQNYFTLGFYITRACGYWFLDVDKCIDRVSGQWNAVATWLYQNLNGAACEISSSGNGVHFFGRDVLTNARAIKPKGTGLELYDDGRGVAFGLSDIAFGSADTSHSAAMHNFIIPSYFPQSSESAEDGAYIFPEERDPTWRGPEDDDELLAMAMRSQSAQAAMQEGDPHKFANLFTGNMDVLHKAYVDGAGNYDASGADFALASMLAFWTGKDGPRMERLMRRSALMRGKWDSHATYLKKFTIARACGRTNAVLQTKEIESTETIDESKEIDGSTFLGPDAQRELFKGCVYVADIDKVFVPFTKGGYQLMKSKVFNAWFANYKFVMDKANTQMAKSPFDAFTGSTLVKFPKVQSAVFMPSEEPGKVMYVDGVSVVNQYVPFPIRRVKGDVTPFLNHVAKLFPHPHDYAVIINYAAACVQYPGKKFMWCPVIQGVQGNGKSTIGNCIAYAVGRQFVYTPSVEDLSSKFNGWLYGNLFILANDVKLPRGGDALEILKPMITEQFQRVEAKRQDQGMKRICCNFLFTMNRKSGIQKEDNERRYAIFFTPQQEERDLERDGLTSGYFRQLNEWLDRDGYALVAEYLATFPIADEYNPAKSLTRAPVTSTEEQVVEASRGTLDDEIREAISEGRPGFNNGWICWQRLKKLRDELNYSRMPLPQLEEIIKRLGYIPHPGLATKGLTHCRVFAEDNKQVRLYVVKNHPTIYEQLTHSQIAERYCNEQLAGSNLPAVAVHH